MKNTKKLENRQPSRDLDITLADLRSETRWCCWRVEQRVGQDGTERAVKVPSGAGGGVFRANDAATWQTWYDAYGFGQANGRGLGVALGRLSDTGVGAGQALIGIDFDSCLGGGGGGDLADWAGAVIDTLDGAGMIEVSPSGTGLKAFMLARTVDLDAIRAALDIPRWWRSWKLPAVKGVHAAGVEFVLGARYFTVTSGEAGFRERLGLFGVVQAQALAGVLQAWFGDGAGGRRGGAGGVSGIGGGDVDVTDDMVRAVGAAIGGDGTGLTASERALVENSPRVRALWRQEFQLEGPDKTRSTAAWHLAGELRKAGLEVGAGVRLMLKCDWVWEMYQSHDEWQGQRQLARAWWRHDERRVGAGLGPVEPVMASSGRAVGADVVDGYGNAVDGDCDAGVDEAEPAPRPVVQLRVGVDRVVDAAEAAIESSAVDVYQRGGALVRPYAIEMDTFNDQKTLAPGFDVLSAHSAIDILARTIDWVKWHAREKQLMPADPPEQIAHIWLSRRGFWRARRIKGILTAPTIRPDGSLIVRPGYDPASRLYMIRDPLLRMPDNGWDGDRLVKADAEQAMQLLESLLAEFPFVSEMDKSVARSGLMMPVVKGALDKRPLHVFDAPNAGTGKTYLVELCTALALGQAAPVSSWSKDESENEKRLSTLLLSGTPVGVLDNVNGLLESDLLCQALDQSNLRVRVFGKLEQRDVENNICLYGTGNNIVVSGDLVRRSLVAKLDAQMERPETRLFHDLPLNRIQQDRGHYLAAVLTIVRAHIQAGYPGCEGMRPMASFDQWGKLVRGALRWLGRVDPVDTAERTFREDPKRSDLADFIEAWTRRYGYEEISLREAFDRLNQVGGDARPLPETYFSKVSGVMTSAEVVSNFRETALRIAGRNDVVDLKVLGNWLKRHKMGVINYHRFVIDSADKINKVQRWRVEKVAAHLKPLLLRE